MKITKIRNQIDKMTEEEVMLIMDKCYERLTDRGWQWHDVLYNVYGWLNVHAPQAQEEYLDGSNPIFYYGPKDE